jgi:NAD(P)-dependent dehydrogenase (short-subunit alcohol dehydrogenase family)
MNNQSPEASIFPMHGKVALVTGGNSGIGRATAEAFAAQGAAVVISARRADLGGEAAAAIEAAGGKARFVQADIAREADVERMVNETISAFGRLDYAVNNASIEGSFASVRNLPLADWQSVIDINLTGTFLCLQHECEAMIRGGGGSIVNVGSVNSLLGSAGVSAYAASKHGQIGLTRSAAAELAPQGIRVNIVCPGAIETDMLNRVRGVFGPDTYDEHVIGRRTPLARKGRPEEVAGTIVFLCTPAAGYITGAVISADGGWTAIA